MNARAPFGEIATDRRRAPLARARTHDESERTMSAVIPFVRPLHVWPMVATGAGRILRVEAALIRAGIRIASDHGISDEGEPWFVFCRPDGDAIMHFARIDGSYLIASDVLDHPVRGCGFPSADRPDRPAPSPSPAHPGGGRGTKLVVHPAALLAALVAAAALILSSEDAHAGEIEPGLPASASSFRLTTPPRWRRDRVRPSAAPRRKDGGAGRAGQRPHPVRGDHPLHDDLRGGSPGERPWPGERGSRPNPVGSGERHAHAMAQGDLASGLGSGAAAGTGATSHDPARDPDRTGQRRQSGHRLHGAGPIRPVDRIDLPQRQASPCGPRGDTDRAGRRSQRRAHAGRRRDRSGRNERSTGRGDGHADATIASSAGYVADGSDPRGNAPQPSASELTTSSRLAGAAHPTQGSGEPASQARILTTGQTETGRIAAVSALREGMTGAAIKVVAHWPRSPREGPKVERADDGPSHGPGPSGQSDLPGRTLHRPRRRSYQRRRAKTRRRPQVARTRAPETDPASTGGGLPPRQGPLMRRRHRPALRMEIRTRRLRGRGAGERCSPRSVASHASPEANAANTGGGPTSHGQNPTRPIKRRRAIRGMSPHGRRITRVRVHHPVRRTRPGPGKQEASHADQNTSDPSSPSSSGRHDAMDHDAATQGGFGPTGRSVIPGKGGCDVVRPGPEKLAGGPEQSQGHGPSSEHGLPGQKGDEQDHSGPNTSANAENQTGRASTMRPTRAKPSPNRTNPSQPQATTRRTKRPQAARLPRMAVRHLRPRPVLSPLARPGPPRNTPITERRGLPHKRRRGGSAFPR